MSEIELTIPGDWPGQGRPRVTRRGITYDPNAKDKKIMRKLLSFQRPQELLSGPIEVNLVIYRRIQKSLSKKRREAELSGEIRPVVKPDLDNKIKLILDAMTGLIWEDDNSIVSINAEEYYSDNPRIDARIIELEGTVSNDSILWRL